MSDYERGFAAGLELAARMALRVHANGHSKPRCYRCRIARELSDVLRETSKGIEPATALGGERK